MLEISTGLHYDKMDVLIDNINDCIEKIQSNLSDIDDEFSSLKKHFDSDTGIVFFSQYEQFKANFPIIITNLQSYSEDFVRAKLAFKQGDISINKGIIEQQQQLLTEHDMLKNNGGEKDGF